MPNDTPLAGGDPAPSANVLGQYRRNALAALVSGLGGALTIWLLAAVTSRLELLLLIPPFGSSCVLLFALPQSPLARPRNVVGGHLISTLMGLLCLTLIGDGLLALGLGVGLAIAAMQLTGTLHPPAGADPLVVMVAGAGWSFLAVPVLAGTLILLAAAWAYHRFVSRRPWPV